MPKMRSDLDIGLPDGITDKPYLEQLDQGLEASVVSRKPDLVIYVAGADPHEDDQLGGLRLSTGGMRERDRRVYAACTEVGAKVVTVLAGGYSLVPKMTARLHVGNAEEFLKVFGR